MKKRHLSINPDIEIKKLDVEQDSSIIEHNLKSQYDPTIRLLARTLTMQKMPQTEALALEEKLRRMAAEI